MSVCIRWLVGGPCQDDPLVLPMMTACHASGSCTDTKTLFELGIFGLFFPDGVVTVFSLSVRHISSGEDKIIASA